MRKLAAFFGTFALVLLLLALAGKKETPPTPWVPAPLPEPRATFEQAKAAITEEDVRRNLARLTDPALAGRMSGMKGNDDAAFDLISWLDRHRVGPGVDGYLQQFRVSAANEFKEKSNKQTANVIGFLPGNDPALKNEVIIIGAHMDHIGYGPAMSQSPGRREIHPGADDNASGTCVVMACVKGFSVLNGQNRRGIAFIHFSGEEMGLLGAKHYCENPVWPLSRTFVMINQDMVGRLRGQQKLVASGASKVPGIARAVQNVTGYPFKGHPTPDTGGGSDHAAFAAKGVPVICFHTGQHAQYHTPDDTADRIDVPGLHKISQYVFELAWAIDKIPGSAVQVRYENIQMQSHGK